MKKNGRSFLLTMPIFASSFMPFSLLLHIGQKSHHLVGRSRVGDHLLLWHFFLSLLWEVLIENASHANERTLLHSLVSFFPSFLLCKLQLRRRYHKNRINGGHKTKWENDTIINDTTIPMVVCNQKQAELRKKVSFPLKKASVGEAINLWKNKAHLPTTMPKAPNVSDLGLDQKSGGCSMPIGTTMVLVAWL